MCVPIVMGVEKLIVVFVEEGAGLLVLIVKMVMYHQREVLIVNCVLFVEVKEQLLVNHVVGMVRLGVRCAGPLVLEWKGVPNVRRLALLNVTRVMVKGT